MKNKIDKIIDIFKQYSNYFCVDINGFVRDKINDNLIVIANANNTKPHIRLYLKFSFVFLDVIPENYFKEYLVNTSNTEIVINELNLTDLELKNIIEKVEDFIKEYEKRYKLYNYIKYTNAIKKI